MAEEVVHSAQDLDFRPAESNDPVLADNESRSNSSPHLPVTLQLESLSNLNHNNVPSPRNQESGGSSPVLNRRRRRRSSDDASGSSPQRAKQETEGGFIREEEATAGTDKNDEEDSEVCPICFDFWSNSGSHRVVSLRCGHLFGQSCIERWIHTNGKGSKCPQCNEPVLRKDIRPIYVRNLKAIDTAERDRALSQLEAERETKRLLELEYHKLQLQLNFKNEEITRLQQELQQCRAALSGACLAASGQAELPLAGGGPLFGSQPPGILGKRLVHEINMELCKDGSCRVLAYSEYLTLLVASYAGTNTTLLGTGVKRINALDGFRTCGYIPLHRKPIRDMAFHREQHDMLLTVSLDKSARLVNIHSASPVQTFNTEAPLWSCCWNLDNSFQFFAGTSTGKVLLFDTRKDSTPVDSWSSTNCTFPVARLGYLPFSPISSFSRGGLFAQRLNSCTFYEARGSEEFVPHVLPVEGSFSSLSIEPETRHVLISCKPSNNHAEVRHIVCAPSWTPGSSTSCSCQPVTCITGGNTQTFLSRPCLMAVPGSSDGKQLIVSAYHESLQSVLFWDVNSSSVVQKLPAPSPALDLLPFRVNGQQFFAALAEKQLNVYKWV